MTEEFDPKRLRYLRAHLEEKGHSFGGFPLKCVNCGTLIGALSMREEAAPACPRPAPGPLACDPAARNAFPIDPKKPFETELVYGPELRAKLRAAATGDCVVCLGEGLFYHPSKGYQMCACVSLP